MRGDFQELWDKVPGMSRRLYSGYARLVDARLKEGEHVLFVNQLDRSLAKLDGRNTRQRVRFTDKQPCVVVVTDRRLYIVAGKVLANVQEILPRDIVSIESESRVLFGSVVVYTSVSGYQFDCAVTETQPLVDAINMARVAGAAPTAPVSEPHADDVPTQIRKLAELRDAGILSGPEFEAKKTELLKRM
jgi:hypothetical protein